MAVSRSSTTLARPALDFVSSVARENEDAALQVWELAHTKAQLSRRSTAGGRYEATRPAAGMLIGGGKPPRPDSRMLLEGLLARKISGYQASRAVAGTGAYTIAKSTAGSVVGGGRPLVASAGHREGVDPAAAAAAAAGDGAAADAAAASRSPSPTRSPSRRWSTGSPTAGRSSTASSTAPSPTNRRSTLGGRRVSSVRAPGMASTLAVAARSKAGAEGAGGFGKLRAAAALNASRDTPSKLRDAIAAVVRQQHRPKKGENLIALLRRMRQLDIHMGGLVTRIKCVRKLVGQIQQGGEEGMVQGAAGDEGAAAAPKGAVDAAAAAASTSRAAMIALEAQRIADADPYEGLQYEPAAAALEEEYYTATRDFDTRHEQHRGSTQRAIATLKFEVEAIPPSTAYRRSVIEVFRNRYAPLETYNPFNPKPQRRNKDIVRKTRRKWRVEESIWAPRREHGNSKDFYETPRALAALLMTDWKLARIHHVLSTNILKTQLEYSEYAATYALDVKKETHPEAPEVRAVFQVLKKHAHTLYGAYFHYAMVGKSPRGKDPINDMEMSYIGLNQFYEFVADCELAKGEFEVSNVWSVVDAPDKYTRPLDPHNRSGALNRMEWVQVIVRLAMRMKLSVGDKDEMAGDVAAAVDEFCTELEATLPPITTLNRNVFRSRYCYTEGTDRVLRQYEGTLRTLFDCYAGLGNHGMNDPAKMASTELLTIGEWSELFNNCGLVELGFLKQPVLMQAFSISRIRSAKDHSHASEMRVRHLTFEDFMEALLRLANIIALPTNEEIEETQAADHGDFLMALLADAQATFRQFVARRTGDLLGFPRQRIDKCLSGLLSLMCRMIEANGRPAGGGASRGPATPS